MLLIIRAKSETMAAKPCFYEPKNTTKTSCKHKTSPIRYNTKNSDDRVLKAKSIGKHLQHWLSASQPPLFAETYSPGNSYFGVLLLTRFCIFIKK